MFTIQTLLQQATTLAVQDGGFDPMLGLKLGILELHAATYSEIGTSHVPTPTLPETVAGCTDVLFEHVRELVAQGHWTDHDSFLLLLADVRRAQAEQGQP